MLPKLPLSKFTLELSGFWRRCLPKAPRAIRFFGGGQCFCLLRAYVGVERAHHDKAPLLGDPSMQLLELSYSRNLQTDFETNVLRGAAHLSQPNETALAKIGHDLCVCTACVFVSPGSGQPIHSSMCSFGGNLFFGFVGKTTGNPPFFERGFYFETNPCGRWHSNPRVSVAGHCCNCRCPDRRSSGHV